MKNNKMSYNDFKELLSDYLDSLGEGSAKITNMKKINADYEGITIEGSNAKPVFNIGALYEALDEFPLPAIFAMIRKEIENAKRMDDTIEQLKDYSWAKNNLFIRLSNKDRNEELLKEVPYRVIADDLVVTYHVKLASKNGELASTTVSEKLMDSWGVTEDELHDDAVKSGTKMFLPVVSSLGRFVGLTESASGAYVITNEKGVNGAAAIVYPGVLEDLRKEIGEDFYVLPASINECIAVRKDDRSPELFRDMVRAINSVPDLVGDDIFLSDNIYEYSKGKLVRV